MKPESLFVLCAIALARSTFGVNYRNVSASIIQEQTLPGTIRKRTTKTLDCMARTKASIDFEKALAELEKLVERMEQGDIPLEESLKAFERGVQLTRLCQKALKDAEQKVRILLEENDKIRLKPFSDES